jgi:hypothetical protein
MNSTYRRKLKPMSMNISYIQREFYKYSQTQRLPFLVKKEHRNTIIMARPCRTTIIIGRTGGISILSSIRIEIVKFYAHVNNLEDVKRKQMIEEVISLLFSIRSCLHASGP